MDQLFKEQRDILYSRETFMALFIMAILCFDHMYTIATYCVIIVFVYRTIGTESKLIHVLSAKEYKEFICLKEFYYQQVMGLNASSVSTLRTSRMSTADSSFLGTKPGAASMDNGEKLSSTDQSNSSARFNEPPSSTSEENLSTGTAQFA